jgi:hypothetical protein
VNVEPEDLNADEMCVYQFLKNWPDQFVPATEVNRRANQRTRFLENPRWAMQALYDLVERGLITSDGFNRYQVIQENRTLMPAAPFQFICPQIMEILARNAHNQGPRL